MTESQQGFPAHPAHRPGHRPNGAEPTETPLSSSGPTTRHLQASDGATWPWIGLPYFLGAILASFLLVLAIQYGSGYYNPISIKLLVASVTLSLLLIPALFLAQSSSPATKKSRLFSTDVLIYLQPAC